MISIIRPTKVPAKLSSDGSTEDANNRAAYDKAPTDYVSGKEKFKISNAIYGHATVKAVLKKAQHNKCCFCEKDQVEEFGAVEHFRPKNGYKTRRKTKLIKPGYYWCAYNWNNLFFVCSLCNSATYKGNLFPIGNEVQRAKSHHGDVNLEDPLLIDPAKIDPRNHIYFKDELAYAKTMYGAQTINICGLDRETLNTKRRELIDHLKSRIVTITNRAHLDPCEVQKARDYLKNSMAPNAQFSAVAIDYLSQFNIK